MAFLRAAALITLTACVAGVAAPARAESLEECAQRVIRDWYSGGRVDDLYPLPCYRAAIRALPEDVLQYSDADRDIARALAYARRGLKEREHASAQTRSPARARGAAPVATPEVEPSPTERRAPARPEPIAPRAGLPTRLTAGPEHDVVSASLPYPVIGLAALSGVLLVTGAVGWIVGRRRGEGTSSS